MVRHRAHNPETEGSTPSSATSRDIIPGRMFPPDADLHEQEAFWQYGAGAMMWRWIGGRRHLALLVPRPAGRHPDCLSLSVDGKSGDNDGVWKWDGDEHNPTLAPSIHVKPAGWHGFLRGGDLHPA